MDKYITFKLILYIIFLSILFTVDIYPQTNIIYISGKITDKVTKKPVQNANVYLAYTTLGSSTNSDGKYLIKDIPVGRYTLVISHIGYQTFHIDIAILDKKKYNFDLELDPRIYQFRPIKVSAEGRQKWLNNLETFKNVFIGKTKNAENTFIQNTIELNFIEKDDTLFAETEKPLVIFNKALGYKIEYSLIHFEYIENEYVKYSGFPKFNLLKTNDLDTLKLWKSNRGKVFLGSLRHFLQLICENYYLTNKSLDTVEYNVDFSDSSVGGYRVYYPEDNYLKKNGFLVLNKSSIKNIYGFNPIFLLVNTNKYLSESKNGNEMYLKFENFLEVKYPIQNNNKLIQNDLKTSLIKLEIDSVLIDKQGRYFETFGIKSFGYWSTQRLADTLPYEYVLPDSVFVK